MDDDIPYLLLTPGPLTTSKSVKQVMLNDFCTWDDDYNHIVSDIRSRLTKLAQPDGGARQEGPYTSVLMQGSGTFSVEATIGSTVPEDGGLLVATNGAYGRRIQQIAERLRIRHVVVEHDETETVDPARVEEALVANADLTHVAMVHCETTTGLLNPAAEVGAVVRRHGRIYLLDAMSSFGGMPMTMDQLGAHFLISSANKCIQGVPGFGFVIADRTELERCAGRARSLSMDLFQQWDTMQRQNGKWRFTSPTHCVRAFAQALLELEEEGGVAARAQRFQDNHRLLVVGMEELGFRPLIDAADRSPFITSFLYPDDPRFAFDAFYAALKVRRFVIYPGKVSSAQTFRIGTIGHLFPDDIRALLQAIAATVAELQIHVG